MDYENQEKMTSLHDFVDICGQLSSLAYKISLSDEDVQKSLENIEPSLSLIKFERTPIGSIAVHDPTKNILFIAYRGTDNNISQYLIDGSIAFLADESRKISEFSDAMGSMNRFGVLTMSAISMLRNNGGEEAGKDLLQSFSFRAVMFARQAASIVGYTNRVIITGHSLGGLYAQVVAKLLIHDVITFGAPGAMRLYEVATKEIDFYLPFQVVSPFLSVSALHITSEGDLIGTYGQHEGEIFLVPYVPLKGVSSYLQGVKDNCLRRADDQLKLLQSKIKSPRINEDALQLAKQKLKISKANQSAFKMMWSYVASTEEQKEVDNISNYLAIDTLAQQMRSVPIDVDAIQSCLSFNESILSYLRGVPTAATLAQQAHVVKLKDAHSIACTLASYHLKRGASLASAAKVLKMNLEDDTSDNLLS